MSPAERRALINKPFPNVRRLSSSYPHGGTIVGDSMRMYFGDEHPRSSARPVSRFAENGGPSWDNIVEHYEDDSVPEGDFDDGY
jgi:hypothetical protein